MAIGHDDEFDYLDDEDDSSAENAFAPKIKGSSKPSLVPEDEVNTEPAAELKEEEKEIEEEAKVEEEKPAREFESQIYIVKVTTNKEDKALEMVADKVNKKKPSKKNTSSGKKAAAKKEAFKPLTRRSFLKAGALGALLIGGTTTAMLPLRKFKNDTSLEGFFQQHYERLTPDRMDRILERIEGELKERHGVDVTVKDPKPIPGVQFAYALNISRCVGCRRCVHACVEENNQSRDPEIQYIRVLEMPEGTFDLEKSDHYYAPDKVPAEGKYYMPVQCQQCENPACVKACPVGATWKDDHLWVENYEPETNTCHFNEYSKGNLLQGRVTIKNCSPLMP